MPEATEPLAPLTVVALLRDRTKERLLKGSVGTVVERLSDSMVEVEFSGDDGCAYAIVPLAEDELLPLRRSPSEPASSKLLG